MTIKIHIDRALIEHQISVRELSKKIGTTSANISILKKGNAKSIRFSKLESLCKALGCQPGDLLEYTEGG